MLSRKTVIIQKAVETGNTQADLTLVKHGLDLHQESHGTEKLNIGQY